MARSTVCLAVPARQLVLALMLSTAMAAAHAQSDGEAGAATPADVVHRMVVAAPAPASPMEKAMEQSNPEAMIGQVVNSLDMGAVASMLERSLAQAASGQAGTRADSGKASPEAEAMQKQMAAQMQAFSRSLMVALSGMIRPMLMGLQSEMRESFRQR